MTSSQQSGVAKSKTKMKRLKAGICKCFTKLLPGTFCMVKPASSEKPAGCVTPSVEASSELGTREANSVEFLNRQTAQENQVDLSHEMLAEDQMSRDMEGDFSNASDQEFSEERPDVVGGAGDTYAYMQDVVVSARQANLGNRVFPQDFESEEDSSRVSPVDGPESGISSLEVSDEENLMFEEFHDEAQSDRNSVLQMTESLIRLAFQKSLVSCPPETLELLQFYYFVEVWMALQGEDFCVTPEKERNVEEIFHSLTRKISCSDEALILLLATHDPVTRDTLVECFREHLAVPMEKLPTSKSSTNSPRPDKSTNKNVTHAALRLLVRDMLDETKDDSELRLSNGRIMENVNRLVEKIWTELESKDLNLPLREIPGLSLAILKDLYKRIPKKKLMFIINLDISLVDERVASCVIKHLRKLQRKRLFSCRRALNRVLLYVTACFKVTVLL